jgi:hypothetical protein
VTAAVGRLALLGTVCVAPRHPAAAVRVGKMHKMHRAIGRNPTQSRGFERRIDVLIGSTGTNASLRFTMKNRHF